MFTVRKLALRFLSQISFYFWSIGFYNSTINLFVSTVNILFSRMNLSNWTITLYFSTSEFKLDTLLSGLACHIYRLIFPSVESGGFMGVDKISATII